MKTSNLLLATQRENPSDAETVSHQLMIKAGLIRQVAAGIYNWLPTGKKVLRKVEEIIRKEMDSSGAQEILMPMVQPTSLWEESGRIQQYGKELLVFQDRHERSFCLGPTHEEVITDLCRNVIKSHRELPITLYQIQTKFRDEIRPRFGVMRGREFLMKDNYSFDLDFESAKKSYNNMYRCYLRTFLRLGLTPIALKAESGAIGGNLSHEFQILANTGESTLYYDKDLENINPANANISELQEFYAAVDDEHNAQKCPIDKSQLKISKGVEVGHIFYFGTKYSEKLNAFVQTKSGSKVPVEMGSYGIGISRLVGAIIEAFHDEKGIKWPKKIAPFFASLINVSIKDKLSSDVSNDMYDKFTNHNIDILYDNRDVGLGVKFSDSDLIGVPFKIIIGPRDIKNNKVEIEDRNTGDKMTLSIDEAFNFIHNDFKAINKQ